MQRDGSTGLQEQDKVFDLHESAILRSNGRVCCAFPTHELSLTPRRRLPSRRSTRCRLSSAAASRRPGLSPMRTVPPLSWCACSLAVACRFSCCA